MYNFYLKKDEELVYVFDDIYIKINEKEIVTTVAITTLRLLFLDYINIDDEFRIAKYQNNIRYKEPYLEFNLSKIKEIKKDKLYKIVTEDNTIICFDNNILYKLLKK